MSKTIHAVFENGVFRPLEKVDLPEQTQVAFEPRVVQASWWEFLQSRRAELLAQGHTFRTREEIDTDRASQKSLDEARQQALERRPPAQR